MNKYLVMVMLFVVCTVSCQKSELPTDESFTDCKNCTFTYQVTGGSGIMFAYKNYWDGHDPHNSGSSYNGLAFEVPSGLTAFDYGKEELISDKVRYIVMCISCGVVPYQPVDGKITGKKVGKNRWLVDANVILEAPNINIRDTMVFKQYFTKE